MPVTVWIKLYYRHATRLSSLNRSLLAKWCVNTSNSTRLLTTNAPYLTSQTIFKPYLTHAQYTSTNQSGGIPMILHILIWAEFCMCNMFYAISDLFYIVNFRFVLRALKAFRCCSLSLNLTHKVFVPKPSRPRNWNHVLPRHRVSS